MALLPTGFGKSLIYQPLPIVSERLGRQMYGKAIIVIVSPLVALMDDQVKEAAKLGLCAAQLAVHNDREIMEGNFSLIFGRPESWILNPKWQAMLALTLYQDNGAYKWWVCIHGFGYWLQQVNLFRHRLSSTLSFVASSRQLSPEAHHCRTKIQGAGLDPHLGGGDW